MSRFHTQRQQQTLGVCYFSYEGGRYALTFIIIDPDEDEVLVLRRGDEKVTATKSG